MKISLIFVLVLSAFSLSAQDTTETRFYTSELRQGEMLTFGSKSILFKDVISDSRCPKEVTCIWAGEAKILVEIFEEGERLGEKILTLQPTTTVKVPIEYFKQKNSYLLSAFNLKPLPQKCLKNINKKYSLELRIEENLN